MCWVLFLHWSLKGSGGQSLSSRLLRFPVPTPALSALIPLLLQHQPKVVPMMAFSLLQFYKVPLCCGDSLIILPFPPTLKYSDLKGSCAQEIISPPYNRTNWDRKQSDGLSKFIVGHLIAYLEHLKGSYINEWINEGKGRREEERDVCISSHCLHLTSGHSLTLSFSCTENYIKSALRQKDCGIKTVTQSSQPLIAGLSWDMPAWRSIGIHSLHEVAWG